MQSLYVDFLNGFELSGDILKDGYNFLARNKYPRIAEHSLQVALQAAELAKKYNEDVKAAAAAGILHDISVVFPNSRRVEVSRQLGIEILKEEEEFPLILHQKISKAMAKDIFGIDDNRILNAIACHTTLKADPSKLDMILFIADKLKWDQIGTAPYYSELNVELDKSLEEASLFFINYKLDNKAGLKVLHPWLLSAYRDLSIKLNKSFNHNV